LIQSRTGTQHQPGDTQATATPRWPLSNPDGPCQTRVALMSLRKLHQSHAGSHPGDALGTPKSHPSHTRVTRGSNPSYSGTRPFYTCVGPKSHPSHTRVTLRLPPVTPTMHRGYTQSTPRSPRSNTRVKSGLHTRIILWFCLGSALHAPDPGTTRGDGRLPPGDGRTSVVARAWT